MTDPLDAVRQQLTALESIDMGPVPVAGENSGETPDPGDGSGDEAPPPDMPPDDNWMLGGDLPPPDAAETEAERIERAALEPLNDVGNGRRFVIHFGADHIYVPAVGWYGWTGTHWQRDEHTLTTRGKAQQLHPLIEKETRYIKPKQADLPVFQQRIEYRLRLEELQKIAAVDRTPEEANELGQLFSRMVALDKLLDDFDKQIGRRLSFANDVGNSGRIDKLLQESQVPLLVPYEAMDAEPCEINCLNGLMRFTVSEPVDEDDTAGKVASVVLVPHERSQRVTKLIPVAYDPAKRSPLWEAVIARAQPDIQMREFLQRWFGLSMTAIKSQHLAFFHGGGANSKSVIVDIVARIMGGYAASLKIESITGANRRGGADATPDLVPLMGARFVRTSEPDQGVPLQESMIKQMTGSEPFPVRANYGSQIDIPTNFKITMSGNHKPDVRGTDYGIWRRLLLVPFDVQIPVAERDEQLGDKLWAERDGIFTWLVEGLLSYLEIGLSPPAAVRDATDEYREESDPIGNFLTSCCVISGDPKDSITAARMIEVVGFYLFACGLTVWKPATITRQIAEKSRTWKHPHTGKKFQKSKASVSQYIGLRLTEKFETEMGKATKDTRGQWVSAGQTSASPDPIAEY